MNISVKKVSNDYSWQTGGGCAVANLEIEVDETLPIEIQRSLVIHEIIENLFWFLPHSKVDEVEEMFSDALSQLESPPQH